MAKDAKNNQKMLARSMKAAAAFRRAIEAADSKQLVDIMSKKVALRSPAVIDSAYPGRDVVVETLGYFLEIVKKIQFVDHLLSKDGATQMLIIEARVKPYRLQGCFYLKMSASGKIDEVTFILRPLHAVQTLVSAMGAKGAKPALDLLAGGE